MGLADSNYYRSNAQQSKTFDQYNFKPRLQQVALGFKNLSKNSS